MRQVRAELFPAEAAGVGAGGDIAFALFHFWGSPAPQGGGEDASSPLPQHAPGYKWAQYTQWVQGERPHGGGAALHPSAAPQHRATPTASPSICGWGKTLANASPSPVTGKG